MSRVTDTILSFSCQEEEKKRIAEVNNEVHLKLVSRWPQLFPLEEPEVPAGGYKAWQTCVRFCAFNNSPTSVILGCVHAANWRYPDEVQLLVREEDARTWMVFGLDLGELEDQETLDEIRWAP